MRSVSITFRPRRTLTVPQPSQVWCIPQSLFIVHLINWANAAAAEETFRFESLVQFSTLWVVLATAARFKAPTQYISWPHDNINWDQLAPLENFMDNTWVPLGTGLGQLWGSYERQFLDYIVSIEWLVQSNTRETNISFSSFASRSTRVLLRSIYKNVADWQSTSRRLTCRSGWSLQSHSFPEISKNKGTGLLWIKSFQNTKVMKTKLWRNLFGARALLTCKRSSGP